MMKEHAKTKAQLLEEVQALRQRIAELETAALHNIEVEQALRENEGNYRRLHESMMDAYVKMDMSGKIIEFNRAYQEMLGYSAEEILRLTYVDLTPARWHEFEAKIVAEQILPHEYSEVYEKEYIRKDGTIFPVELRTFLIRDEREQPVAMWAIVRDITVRKREEEKLRSSEERFRSMLDNMLEGCQIIGFDWRYIYLNNAADIHNRRPKEELLGKKYMDMWPGIETTEVFSIIKHCMEKRIPHHLENEFVFPDGTVGWFDLSIQPVPEGVFILSIDISERKRAEQERSITIEFLRLINEYQDTRALIRSATTFFQQQSGCQALGVRLKEGDDYPYFEARGFPQEFLLMENSLCARDLSGQLVRDSIGNPVIECMCGNVICGRFDPSKPFFTAHGSFWSNSTTALLASTTEADRQTRTRNRCNGEGYESVALLPLVSGDDRLGLLQLNDRRKGVFSPELIALWERLAGYLAVALAKSRAEEALRENRLRLQLAIDSANIGIHEWNILTNEMIWDDRVYEFWGLPPGTPLTYEMFMQGVHPDDRGTVQAAIDPLFDPEGDGKYFIQYRVVGIQTGIERWLELTGQMLFEDRRPVRFIGMAIDITARKRAEEEIAYLAKFPYENPNPVLRLSQDGSVMYANAASNRLLDMWGCVVGGYAPQSWRNMAAQALANRENKIVDTECDEKIYSFFVVPVVEAGYVNLYGRDISARKQVEEQLRQSEHELRIRNRIANIFLTIPDENMYNEILQIILETLASPFGVFGYLDENEDLVVPTMARHIWDRHKVPDKNIVFPWETWGESTWPRTIREKKIIVANTPSTNMPEGHIPISRHISMPIIHQNAVVGLLQVANKASDYNERDIALLQTIAKAIAPVLDARLQRERQDQARRKAEEEREWLNVELTQKNKELEQIVYVTSHDLRSPLVNAQGFSKELKYALQELNSLLQSESIPSEIREEAASMTEEDIAEDLEYILSSIAKMDALLSGLLRLSRLGRAALTITTLDMNALVAQIVNTFEFQITEAGVTFEISELPSCEGDETQINQVFSNLVDNALKYLDTHRSGTIKIYGYQEHDQSIYCVEDNGIGIAPEHQEKIFEIFHRLEPTKNDGEGLGLTIVRKILERQGGNVWVESEPGKGSKFYVSLPRGEKWSNGVME